MALRCGNDVTAGCRLLDDGALLVPVPMPTPHIGLVAHNRSPAPLLASMPNQRDGRLDKHSPSNKTALGGGILCFAPGYLRSLRLPSNRRDRWPCQWRPKKAMAGAIMINTMSSQRGANGIKVMAAVAASAATRTNASTAATAFERARATSMDTGRSVLIAGRGDNSGKFGELRRFTELTLRQSAPWSEKRRSGTPDR